jgi:hypothetical protein
VHHERLVVEYQRIGLPAPVPLGFVIGHALFEVGGAVDLAGDENAVIQKERWLAALESEALHVVRHPAGRHARVEQQGVGAVASPDGNQGREAVLGEHARHGGALLEQAHGHGRRPPHGPARGRHQRFTAWS